MRWEAMLEKLEEHVNVMFIGLQPVEKDGYFYNLDENSEF